MSRKKSLGGRNRKIKRDVKYQSEIVEMLASKLMFDGKKTTAYRICYNALQKAGQKLNCSPQEALEKAMGNVKPFLEVKPRRVGGATYQVPVEVTPRRGIVLGIRWIVDTARSKRGKSMDSRLSEEIVFAARGEGAAVKKREDTHKMAEANKAFAHYRW
jgi:small subunit ribosomal protein S7